MQEKYCSRCKSTKPINLFYKNRSKSDGLSSWCKECTNTLNHTDAAHRNKRKYSNSDKGKNSLTRYRSTQAFRQSQRDYNNKKRQSTAEKIRHSAHERVRYRIKTGKLPHPSTLLCVDCGNRAEHYHHYNGYACNDVVPICASCHRSKHEQFQKKDQ